MSWVGVRYRGIALPDIMKMMRIWLDQRQFQPKTFECAISGSGTLVRVQFAGAAEAAEFAEAFAGVVSEDRPSIEGAEANTVESLASHRGVKELPSRDAERDRFRREGEGPQSGA